MVGMKDPQII